MALREGYICEETLKEEVICDFNVSEEMKRVWAAEVKVLEKVIEICERHNITYYADYGTLLGTVRHKGFIPWDDDIDICLKRNDYMKLIECLKEELPSGYCLNSCYTVDTHRQPWSSVTNYKSVPVPHSIQKEFYDCPYVVGIDIYMLDYVPRDKELAELMINMYEMVYDLAQRYEEYEQSGELEQYVCAVEELCSVKIIRDNTLRNQLLRLDERIASMFNEEECDELTLLPRVVQGDYGFRYDKHWFDNIIKMEYNGLKINVPCGYDKILTAYYGNYMECVPMVSAHDYPFFKVQKEYLEQNGLS